MDIEVALSQEGWAAQGGGGGEDMGEVGGG